MERIRVTLSANAGVAIEAGGHRIWVDALHETRQPGFSALTPELLRKMAENEAFSNPACICFTHCHPDHYSQRLTLAAKEMWPNAGLFLPEQVFPGQTLVTGDAFDYIGDGYSLRFLRLPHEGAQYAGVRHYGILLRMGECRMLIPGDCAVDGEVLLKAVGDAKINLALLNFPWITLARGRAFLRKLAPEHILAYHLPFREDDVSGYRESARRNAEALAKETDIRLLWEPLQTEEIKIADVK